MRKLILIGIFLAIAVLILIVPWVPEFRIGGGPEPGAWISPSFGLFQCGFFEGSVSLYIPNNANTSPPYGTVSILDGLNWNCAFPYWAPGGQTS